MFFNNVRSGEIRKNFHRLKAAGLFATTWMELEGIMLSEISQAEKDKY